MHSYTNADIVKLNNACGVSQKPAAEGYKLGGGRAVFSATDLSKVIGAYDLGLTVPKGAFVTRVLYWVSTTFTSSTDAATIALKLVSANDVVSAIAISNGGNPWDTTSVPVATIVTPTLSTNFHTTADASLTATVAVENLTAGKMFIWVEWIYHGDQEAT